MKYEVGDLIQAGSCFYIIKEIHLYEYSLYYQNSFDLKNASGSHDMIHVQNCSILITTLFREVFQERE